MKKAVATLTLVVTTLLNPPLAYAQLNWSTTSGCTGSNVSYSTGTGTANASDVATLSGLSCLFQNTLRVVLPLIGFGIFIMLILGGYKILFSGGDAKVVEAGKNTLTQAIYGLVLAILSWTILFFIAEFTGISNLLKFTLPN